MTERWRFVDAGARDAPDFFGRMPVLAAAVAGGGPPVLMTGVFDRGHFQIGWFEDVDAVIDLDAARAAGVQVFRRPVWGGGTAFYDTRASALVSFFVPPAAFPTVDAALERFRPVMRRALDALGLADASFEGSSDLRWRGRKLGTVIAQDVLGARVVGGFLNLRKPDLDLYARVARPPEEKFADKEVKDPVAYICTPGEVRGSDVAYEEFRDAVAAAARADGFELEARGFTPEEDAGVEGFVSTVSADDWVRRVSSARFRAAAAPGDRIGFANLKARKLVRAGVALDVDGHVARAMIAGDMHVAPPEAMDAVAAALGGARADDREELLVRVRAALAGVTQPDEAAGITPEDLVEAVLLAVKNAP